MAFVVGNAPADLRDSVAPAGQRQNDVVVNLSHGGTVTAETLAAAALAVQDLAVSSWRVLFEPAQQCGTEVKADARVVVHDARDLVLDVYNPRRAVGRVALRANPLVPVVVGRSGILRLDSLQPRILARRLVKVTMNTNEALACGH